MAIYTKNGERLINESLRVDESCLSAGEIVKVWAVIEGQTAEKQYWLSDLRGDHKHEMRDVMNANLKKRGEMRSMHTTPAYRTPFVVTALKAGLLLAVFLLALRLGCGKGIWR